RNHHALSAREHCRAGGEVRIARAKVPLFVFRRHALQQALGIRRRHPAAVFGDADGNDFKLVLIDGVEDRRCREQRNLMLAAAPSEKNADPNLFHDLSVWDGGAGFVNLWRGSQPYHSHRRSNLLSWAISALHGEARLLSSKFDKDG